MAAEQMYTVDKFLGLNEAADGYSELKMGAASRMVNFDITDGGNITTRPGFRKLGIFADSKVLNMWCGYMKDDQYLIVASKGGGTDRIDIYRVEDTIFTLVATESGRLGIEEGGAEVVKIFPFGEKVHIMSENALLSIRIFAGGADILEESPYIPIVITGADPMGGGTKLENANLLSSKRRIIYSANGEAKDYKLPEEAVAVISAETDSGSISFEFDNDTNTLHFSSAPVEGVANLTVTYDTGALQAAASRKLVTDMPFYELYNGATDTRVFFYGDGSNLALYSGVPSSGKADALYVPAMNELRVDFSGSPITGMIRHGGKLLCYKPDGAQAITYEPVTLPGGEVIAGFYLRTINKTIGCDTPGQVQLVDNYPRTICGGSLYEWRFASYSTQDERNAKVISKNVYRSLAAADPAKIVTCDDNSTHTYYIFLNDAKGTVLVHRYQLDVWTMYRSALAVNVKQAAMCENNLLFRTDSGFYLLDSSARYDEDGSDIYGIHAVWESGYMDFGAGHRRKFTSLLWFNVKPESYSAFTVTAASDRKSKYAEKTIRSELFDYGKISYRKWSYEASSAIRTKRIKLKVKKVVFYKLIIRVDEPGARATVLGFDQLVRFTSFVK